MKNQSVKGTVNDWGDQQDPKSKQATAGSPSRAAAAEQADKVEELSGERRLKTEQLLAERTLKMKQLELEHANLKKELIASQTKVKDLLAAVRYRDRKISLLVPVKGGNAKVVGANVTDHTHLGEFIPEKTVAPAQVTKDQVKLSGYAPLKR